MSFRLTLLLRAFLLSALLALVGTGTAPAEAASQECSFLMDDGTERSCTFTERYGQCIWIAYQSYSTCQDPADNEWLSWIICEVAYEVDFYACTLEMVGDAAGLLNPF